jgi:hypothetical protein
MERLLPLLILLFFVVKTNAQNGRWMYLKDSKGVTLMVDTLTNDIKELETYNGHKNIVLIWIKTVENKVSNKGPYIESDLTRYAIDTTNKQAETVSAAEYINATPILSKDYGYLPWEDVAPGTGGDIFIGYCKALHNQQLMRRLILNARLDRKASLKKKKNSN